MSLLHLFFGKPTQDDRDRAKAVKSLKTIKVVGGHFVSIDTSEIMASQNYKEAIRQIRKMEADESWGC